MIRILSVASSSPAAGAGIRPGESIVTINGEPVIDEIDYQALIVHPHLEISVAGEDGTVRSVTVAKSRWESLGIVLDETVVMKPRSCRNHCLFPKRCSAPVCRAFICIHRNAAGRYFQKRIFPKHRFSACKGLVLIQRLLLQERCPFSPIRGRFPEQHVIIFPQSRMVL